MADIELVIKIPEDEYRWVVESDETAFANIASKECMLHAIKHGTPLPKGHGRLKDISKIEYRQGVFIDSEGVPLPIIHKIATIEMIRDWLPTIIEADKAESEVEE